MTATRRPLTSREFDEARSSKGCDREITLGTMPTAVEQNETIIRFNGFRYT